MSGTTASVSSTPEKCENDETDMLMEWLTRFLLVGSTSGVYVSNLSSQTTAQSIHSELNECVQSLIARGKRAEIIAALRKLGSAAGSSAKAYVLAACSVNSDPKLRAEALAIVHTVCHDSIDLFAFVQAREFLCKESNNATGWGRSMRSVVGNWYRTKRPKDLGYMSVNSKPNHYGWTHKDILRLAHLPSAKGNSTDFAVVISYLTHGMKKTEEKFAETNDSAEILNFLKDFCRFRRQTCDPAEAASLMEKHSFPYETIPNNLRKSSEFMRHVVPRLTLDELVILLNQFKQNRLLRPNGPILPIVVEQLTNEKKIAACKLHPLVVYAALKRYELIEKLYSVEKFASAIAAATLFATVTTEAKPTYQPVPSLIAALNGLMISATKNCSSSTGKRYLIAMDVGRATEYHVYGFRPVMAKIGAALLIMPLIDAKESVIVVTFGEKDINVSNTKAGMSFEHIAGILTEIKSKALRDCAKPILWAKETEQSFDAFLILTEYHTAIYGDLKPSDALRQYRQKMKLPKSRAIICALSGRKCDQSTDDGPGVMFINGLDVRALDVIREFFDGTGEAARKDPISTDNQVTLGNSLSRLELKD